jgi:hypothetical protein
MRPTLLEELRQHRDVSRDALAAATAQTTAGPVTARTIFAIERQGSTPARRTAQALGEALGVEPALLRRREAAA